MSVADRVLDGLGEGLRRQAGGLLPDLVAALVGELEVLDSIVSGEDGWSVAFDLDLTPYPGWLGQIAGVPQAPGTLSEQRAAVAGRGSTRGTPTALKAAAAGYLTTSDGHGGTTTKRVTLLERSNASGAPAPYRFVLRVYAAQVGDTTNQAALTAAVTAAKPAGLQWDLVVLAGWTYDDALAQGGTYASEIDGTTYDQDSATVPSLTGLATYADDLVPAGALYDNDPRQTYDANLSAS